MKIGLIPQLHWTPIYDSFEVAEYDVLKRKSDLTVFTTVLIPHDKLPPTARQNPDYSDVVLIPDLWPQPLCQRPNFDFQFENFRIAADIIRNSGVELLWALFGHDPGVMAVMLAHNLGIKSVVSFFGIDVNHPGAGRDSRVPFILKHADVVRCESEIMKAKLLSFLPEAEPKIVVCPAAFDPMRFVPKEYQTRDEIKLVSVQRLTEVKGVIPATTSIVKCMDSDPNLSWTIFGSGPDEDAVREIAGDKPIHLPGQITHQQNLNELREFDIAIAPYVITESERDNLPLAVQEFFALGFPVIMGHSMGFQGVEEFTIIAEPGTQEFENAIVTLASNPELRKEMGEKARKYAEENLNFNKNVDKILEKI